jgi:hypothetical protein
LRSGAFRFGEHSFPGHGWAGFALIALAWPLNWLLPGARTAVLFFPLWLGYALAVDGLVYLRKGDSLLKRSPRRYSGLFLVSAPAWWLFEAINLRTQNWFYLGVELFTPLEYFLLASLNFSTVIPAVFGTAELFSTFPFIQRIKPGWVIRDDRKTTLGFFVSGWVMVGLMLAWPRYFFPFVWLSVYFITEPVNVWLGNRNLARGTRIGDWRAPVSLFCGVLVTGFFWEMWNFFAFPKWIYQVPGVDFARLFEMPLLGYGGYLPFALELHALYHFFLGALGQRQSDYVRICLPEGNL